MTAVYHSLASGSFSQNWSNTGLITTNDDWSGVPSIQGFLGQDITTSTGANPTTLTGDSASATDLDVIANQSATTLTNGGVAEFEIANPVVGLQGSGTADAPHLVLYLNAAGRQDIRVQFKARDIDAGDDTNMQLAVQYRVGASGAWSNVTNGYDADVTTGGSATEETDFDVTLPSAANNQSQVQVRIITTNAPGSDEWIGIDDIVVSSQPQSGGGDTTAPTLQSSTPADGATNVGVSSDIVLNFDEVVQAVAGGTVTITNGAGDDRVIDLAGGDPDGGVTFNGSTITINPAANLANGTSYDVVIAAGAIEDTAGNDFAGIALDALDFATAAAGGALTAIYTLQGAGHISAFVGQTVTTRGVVTAVDSNGFYIQDATGDANTATSDGIFVFTSSAPVGASVGRLVEVGGTVSEFTPSNAAPGSLSVTQIVSLTVTDLGAGATITATQLGGAAGRKPPTTIIDDQGGAVYDPVNHGNDFFESLEGMLVVVDNPVAVSPRNGFGEIFTIVDSDDDPANGLNTNSQTARGSVGISGGTSAVGGTNTIGGDFNPERIQIDDDSGILPGSPTPSVSVGARLNDVTGVMSYSFGNYEVLPTQAVTVAAASTLTPETTTLTGTATRLTVANYNVENLDPSDGAAKFNTLAAQIVNNMRAPDIISLQEVQDNDGATNSTTVSASTTLQTLVDAINAAAVVAGSPAVYAFQDNPFIADDQNGGEPGGNIRNAFLYRTDRGIDLVDASLKTISATGAGTTAVGENADPAHPFNASRLPLVADFTFNGQTITVIGNHFSSKNGSGALMGSQPPLNNSEDARAEQAQAVNTYVDSLLATNPNARVVIAGDLNEFEFEEPMLVLEGTATYVNGVFTAGGEQVLHAMIESLPVNQRFDYIFDGNAQSLDHIYASTAARAGAQYDIVHLNAEFANQASDHDALVASFDMSTPLTTEASGDITFSLKGALALSGAEIAAFDPGSDRLFVTSNVGLQVVNFSNPASPSLITNVDFTALGFATTDVTSVAVKNGIVAVALPNADKALPGKVVFLDAATHALLGSVDVGALPDMVTFTPDGTKLLVANEGELNATGTDGEGSVSIIDISGGVASATVQTATFTAFNGQEETLRAEGVRIFAGRSVSQDVEPEYIAVSADGGRALVTLQEANAVAVLDIATATFTDIVPLGTKDWFGLLLDVSDRDGPGGATLTNLRDDMPIQGLFMPDAVDSYTVNGQTYYVIANEGDDRDDFLNPDETIRVGSASYDLDNATFPDEAALKGTAVLGRLTVSNAPGLRGDSDGDGDIDQILAYGGRSFSILDSSGAKIFDSGDILERIVATQFPALFDDTRSDNKGPEPEGIEIGRVGDKTYAFVGLERSHMTLAFDITDPNNVSYAGAAQRNGDLNPEGQLFISAEDSPTGEALLVVSNEVSNNISVFEVEEAPAFTLQLLHLADGEAGLLAADTAPNLAALLDAFDDDYLNTLILAGGDNFLPGPFLNAGTDPSLNSVPSIGATGFGRPDIAIHNALGVEASTIGNHEFDLGSTAFRDSFTPSGLWVGAQFPYLSANLDFSGDAALSPRFTDTTNDAATPTPEANTLKGRIAESAVVTKGGEKIGLVAATTQILEAISSPNGTEVKGFPIGPGANGEVDDMDLLAAQLQPIIDELIAEGVDKIVLMAHLQQIANEQLLATKLRGVDIILAAGSNTRLGDADDEAVAFPGHAATFANTYPIITNGADGKATLIVNTDNEYTYLGRLVVDFDENGDILVDNLTDLTPVNGAYAATTANVAEAWGVSEADLETTAFANGTKGDQVRDITQAVDAVISAKDGNVFGFTDVYLEGERAFVRSEETNLGNLAADSGSFAYRDITGAGDEQFVVGLRNGGGIRAQIGAIDFVTGEKIAPLANPDVGKPEGGVSQLDVENSLRFNNRLMSFDTTAAGLKAILEHGVAAGTLQGRFPQIGGVRFSWDPAATAGNRVQNIALIDSSDRVIARLVENGVVVATAATLITVVTSNFTANGGDGFPIKANGENFRFLLDNGTLSAPVSEALDFTAPANLPANALGEQAALQRYMQEFHATPDTAFDDADTAATADMRIQNLAVRDDDVFQGIIVETPDDGANTLIGTDGDDLLNLGAGDDFASGGAGADDIDLGPGADTLSDTLDDLDGDKIAGFGFDDTLVIEGSGIARQSMVFTPNGTSGATLEIDGRVLNFEGDFSKGDFMAVSRGGDTTVTFESYLPTLRESRPVDPAAINGIANELFLTGDGSTQFMLEFKSSGAAFRNTLGVYRVEADGTIGDVEIVFANTANVPRSKRTVDLGTPDEGERIGLFLIQDGFNEYGRLSNRLSFVDASGDVADLDDGVAPILHHARRGDLTTTPIFHSFATLNPGDAIQVLSGVAPGGQELLIGFEDLARGSGDNDFQDLVIGIRAIPDLVI